MDAPHFWQGHFRYFVSLMRGGVNRVSRRQIDACGDVPGDQVKHNAMREDKNRRRGGEGQGVIKGG
jgi:hypothetical protein